MADKDRPVLRLGEGHDVEYEAFIRSTVEWLEAACKNDSRRGLLALVSVLSTIASHFPDPAEFLVTVANRALTNVMDIRSRMHAGSEGKPS